MLHKNLILFVLLFFALLQLSISQERKGGFGLVFMEDLTSTPLNYGFSFWISNPISLELAGGFESIDLKDN